MFSQLPQLSRRNIRPMFHRWWQHAWEWALLTCPGQNASRVKLGFRKSIDGWIIASRFLSTARENIRVSGQRPIWRKDHFHWDTAADKSERQWAPRASGETNKVGIIIDTMSSGVGYTWFITSLTLEQHKKHIYIESHFLSWLELERSVLQFWPHSSGNLNLAPVFLPA